MSFGLLGKKWICAAAGLGVVLVLGGCGERDGSIQSAMRLIQELDYSGALTELDNAEENRENQRLIDRARGIAYMGLIDYESAITAFEAAIAGSDGLVQEIDFDLNYYLAAAYTKNGQYADAERVYNAILALRPEEEDAWFLRGNVRLVLGNYDGATEDFDRAIFMSPKNYDRLIEIYQVLAYYGHEEAGRAYLRSALDSGDTQMSKYDSGRIYYYLEEYQSAYLALEEARGNGGVESYLYLGRAYEATGDYNYAANVYNSWLNNNEGTAEVYNQLGICEMARGEYQRALEAFQDGLRLQDAALAQTLSFNEIVAYEHLGEFEQAYALIQSYLRNYPDDEQARREYDFLSTR